MPAIKDYIHAFSTLNDIQAQCRISPLKRFFSFDNTNLIIFKNCSR